MLTFVAQVKGRKISSQMTGYEVVLEFQFIITIDDYSLSPKRGSHRVQVVGRWYKTKAEARRKAVETARLLGFRLHWKEGKV